MGYKHHNQQDFSGGEVAPEMIFRDNIENHAKSLGVMLNFVPNLQGNAVRTPGTKFVREVEGTPATARIVPYVTPLGAHTIALITPNDGTPESPGTNGEITILEDVNKSATAPATQPDTIQQYDYINANYDFRDGFDNWRVDRINYISSDGEQLGWNQFGNGLLLRLRRGHNVPRNDPLFDSVDTTVTIAEDCSEIILQPRFQYATNQGQGSGATYGITVSLRVATTGGTEIFTRVITDLQQAGPEFADTIIIPGTFLEDETYDVSWRIDANVGPGNDGDAVSLPVFYIQNMAVLQLVTTIITEEDLTEVVEFTASQLKDVHYIQSPYTGNPDELAEPGKELVFTQGDHPPTRLFLDAGGYQYEEIFTVGSQNYADWDWDTNGFPATCTSFNGRLVLAGSSDVTASTRGSNAERVWTTEVGDWQQFSVAAPGPGPGNPSATDSVDFTSIYRSQIRWVMGKDKLLIGAETLEYVVSSETVFQRGDVQVELLSTHGSNKVQPVAMGRYILFPAEKGTHLRAISYDGLTDNWVAPDLTLTNPRILSSQIKRLVRMRNPHQMAIAVLGSGQLAVMTLDETAQVQAWSRIDVGGSVIDAAVAIDQGNPFQTGGDDILYLLVKRNIEGVNKLYLEAIVNWETNQPRLQHYVNSHVLQLATAGNVNTIGNLDHLEGKYVQVIADRKYIGSFLVEGGEATLEDQFGDPIYYTACVAGLSAPCQMRTLPMASGDPGSIKKYTSLTVQTLSSGRPIINGYRPQDRNPSVNLGDPQYLDTVGYNEVAVTGSDKIQTVTVEETLPIPLTVQRIFGKVTENSV